MAVQPTLLGLPVELATEIIKQLEWTDILYLRQTCKHLAELSHERPIWLQLFYYYLETIQPRAYWPDRSILLYTSEELESMVLKPFKVKRSWRTKNIKPSLSRRIKVGQGGCDHLIPGGRWFLVSTDHGDVNYVDLDAPRTPARTLVPSIYGSGSDLNIITRLSFDMEEDSLLPKFNIAVHSAYFEPFTENRDPLGGVHPIQIWRVTTTVDRKGFVNGLTAQNLASFYEEKTYFKDLVLYKSLVAYSVINLGLTIGPLKLS